MMYHAPLVRLATPEDRVFDGERLGGIPVGLASTHWPRCATCGKSQTLVAQLAHHDARLDLGRAGRMLFVFQCGNDPGMCEDWDAFAGGNSSFVVEPEALGSDRAPLPDDVPPLYPELLITDWAMHDDMIAEVDRAKYMTDDGLGSLSEEARDRAIAVTRLGSVASWVQSADEAPLGWSFVGQLDSADRAVYAFDHAPNFGGSGVAYLFLRAAADGGVPDACMFWQCG